MSYFRISSFQGWYSNDINAWQDGAFYKCKNIDHRKYIGYVTLSRQLQDGYTIDAASLGIPTTLTLWGNVGGWAVRDIVALTSTWKIQWYSGTLATMADSAWNAIESNGKRYIAGSSKLWEVVGTFSSFTDLWTFTNSTNTRPMIDWFGDVIIWDGNSISRLNEGGTTLTKYTAGATNGTIWWLAGNVVSLTAIGTNIYVWCSDGSNTHLYYWDGSSSNPSQYIKYTDMSVANVALLWNQHYWWTKKTDYGIRQMLVGESYQPQVYMKSDYPLYTLESNADNDKNRMIINVTNSSYINAIETMGEIVYLPWYGRIFTFGKYYPWTQYSFANYCSFSGWEVTAMISGWMTTGGQDFGSVLGVCYRETTGNIYHISALNAGANGSAPWPIYNASGEIETIEYLASADHSETNDVKIVVPVELVNSACSIKVWERRDAETSYTLLKTITTTDYGVWPKLVEIQSTNKWRRKQLKFELITTDTTYSPKLYVWVTNYYKEVWNLAN